jgi:hypothetical protein
MLTEIVQRIVIFRRCMMSPGGPTAAILVGPLGCAADEHLIGIDLGSGMSSSQFGNGGRP